MNHNVQAWVKRAIDKEADGRDTQDMEGPDELHERDDHVRGRCTFAAWSTLREPIMLLAFTGDSQTM